jgi:hypothetical protein
MYGLSRMGTLSSPVMFLLSVVFYVRKEFRFSSGEHSLHINTAVHAVAENGAVNSATLSIDPTQQLGPLKLFVETARTSWCPERDQIRKDQDGQKAL